MNRYRLNGGVITDQDGLVRNEIDLQNEKFYVERDLRKSIRLFLEHLDLTSCVVHIEDIDFINRMKSEE